MSGECCRPVVSLGAVVELVFRSSKFMTMNALCVGAKVSNAVLICSCSNVDNNVNNCWMFMCAPSIAIRMLLSASVLSWVGIKKKRKTIDVD